MTTIAIDIQPQYRFSCMAANENRFLHHPEDIVDELNRQARFADKRVLIENAGSAAGVFCQECIEAPLNRSGLVFNQNRDNCRRNHLFSGLPSPADYDHVIETDGDYRHGVCFHDTSELVSTGLLEWLRKNGADTVIIGGLATEDAVTHTAQQLRYYSHRLHIIVNLSACCGYTPETTLKAIRNLREQGITVATHSAEIPCLTESLSLRTLLKVS